MMNFDVILPVTDPNLVNTLVSVFSSVLLSLFKSESWSKETRQKIAMVLSVCVGVGVALYSGKTSLTDFVAFSGMSVGVMQAFYLGIWEKIGAEDLTRIVRSRTIDASKLLVGKSAPIVAVAESSSSYPDMVAAWAKAAGEIGLAFKSGKMTAAEANAALTALKTIYPDAPNIYPDNWFGS